MREGARQVMANRTLYLKDEVVAKLDHLAKEGGARSRSEWLTKTIEDIHAQVGHIYADYTHSIRISDPNIRMIYAYYTHKTPHYNAHTSGAARGFLSLTPNTLLPSNKEKENKRDLSAAQTPTREEVTDDDRAFAMRVGKLWNDTMKGHSTIKQAPLLITTQLLRKTMAARKQLPDLALWEASFHALLKQGFVWQRCHVTTLGRVLNPQSGSGELWLVRLLDEDYGSEPANRQTVELTVPKVNLDEWVYNPGKMEEATDEFIVKALASLPGKDANRYSLLLSDYYPQRFVHDRLMADVGMEVFNAKAG